MRKDFSIISKLLNDFSNFINNRSIIFLVSLKEVFPIILEWHFRMWKKEYKYLGRKNELEKWSSYSEISRILDSILSRIQERSLKERKAFSFFNYFKKHAEKYKKEFIKNKDKQYYYRDSLFDIFYRIFFENIKDFPERYDIWRSYFPAEWKVTIGNLKNKECIISWISLNKFLQWAQERIEQGKEEFDQNLDDVSRNLFPEIDPIIWSKILIFVLSPYGENRVKSVIERAWNFGFAGRIRAYFGDPADSKKEFDKKMTEMMRLRGEVEAKKTFELSHFLFKREFSRDSLEKYIKDIEILKYKKDSLEETKRLQLLNIFKEMKKYLEER